MSKKNQMTSVTSHLAMQETAESATRVRAKYAKRTFSLWMKIALGLDFLWLQVIFFALLFEVHWLVEWGVASFFVVMGLGLVGVGFAWSWEEIREESGVRRLPVALVAHCEVGEVCAAGDAYEAVTMAHCALCDAETGRFSDASERCSVCGFDRLVADAPETRRLLWGYQRLEEWHGVIQGWLDAPSRDAARQVYECSGALVALVSQFPVLKGVSQGGAGCCDGRTSVGEEDDYTAPSDRTWGDQEFAVDAMCAAQEKTQVEPVGGSQMGLLRQALRYTEQLKARMHQEICQLRYCADDLLETEGEERTALMLAM